MPRKSTFCVEDNEKFRTQLKKTTVSIADVVVVRRLSTSTSTSSLQLRQTGREKWKSEMATVAPLVPDIFVKNWIPEFFFLSQLQFSKVLLNIGDAVDSVSMQERFIRLLLVRVATWVTVVARSQTSDCDESVSFGFESRFRLSLLVHLVSVEEHG